MSLSSIFASFQSIRSSHSIQNYTSHADDGKGARGADKTVEVSGQKQQDLTYSAGAPATSAPGYAAPVQGAGVLAGGESRTDAANTILNFIAGRVRLDAAEGATPEELASRLEAGLSGFMKGFQEAYEQLAGMGFLYAEVGAAIEKTYTDVLDGIDALAEELALDSPVTSGIRADQAARQASFVPAEPPVEAPHAPQTPADIVAATSAREAENLGQLIEASTIDYSQIQSRSFSFELQTRDGDTVTIRAASASAALLNGERTNYSGSSEASVSGSFHAVSGFYLDIQGDIDEGELFAIEDLLVQIREVSDMFFSGNVEEAFNAAVELGFDSEEIAMFSLNLRYQSTTKIEQTYQNSTPESGVSQSSAPLTGANDKDRFNGLVERDARFGLLARFIQALEDMRLEARELGLGGFAKLDPVEPTDKERSPVGIMQELMSRLEGIDQRAQGIQGAQGIEP